MNATWESIGAGWDVVLPGDEYLAIGPAVRSVKSDTMYSRKNLESRGQSSPSLFVTQFGEPMNCIQSGQILARSFNSIRDASEEDSGRYLMQSSRQVARVDMQTVSRPADDSHGRQI